MIDQFTKLITDSILTRLLATVFLFVLLLACVGVAAWQLITLHTIDSLVYGILLAGVTSSLTILGVNLGVNLTPAKNTESTQAAATQAKLSPPVGTPTAPLVVENETTK